MRRGACSSRIKKFKEVFGSEAEVSYKSAEIWRRENRYWKSDFNWLFRSSLNHNSLYGEKYDILRRLFIYMTKSRSIPPNWSLFPDTEILLTKLSNQRFLRAITQVVHMARSS